MPAMEGGIYFWPSKVGYKPSGQLLKLFNNITIFFSINEIWATINVLGDGNEVISDYNEELLQ